MMHGWWEGLAGCCTKLLKMSPSPVLLSEAFCPDANSELAVGMRYENIINIIMAFASMDGCQSVELGIPKQAAFAPKFYAESLWLIDLKYNEWGGLETVSLVWKSSSQKILWAPSQILNVSLSQEQVVILQNSFPYLCKSTHLSYIGICLTLSYHSLYAAKYLLLLSKFKTVSCLEGLSTLLALPNSNN